MSIYSKYTGLKHINFPILTRWGTYLDCVKFIYENLSLLKVFIEQFANQIGRNTAITLNTIVKIRLSQIN